ncbi:MAG: hypothetical protein U9P14_00450 [Gemmatimonadota bacterium]|nr:hypothetical protein [Gemmatimonadota bacterium]
MSNLKTGRTIIIHPGDYRLTRSVYIDGVDSVSIRGATGNREDVILRGKGMTNEAGKGSVPHVIATGNADDLLVADLTVADAWYHNMHLAGSRGPQRPHIYNVHFLDCGEQMLKVNPGYNPTAFPDTGIVEYCRFEYTDRAKHWYTNGVDVLDAANWIVRDCEFVRIRGPEGVLAGSAVLFWHTCYNTVVERNFFYECDFGVTYGITAGSSKRAPDSGWDHVGGIIRNNIIFRKESGDVGISVNHAKDYKVYNNTVILNGTFPWNIEYRWSNSSGEIMNNLCDGSIYRRNEAKGDLAGNITNARPSMFLDFDNIDLHLDESGAGAAIDAGVPLDEVIDDWDGHPRDEPDYLDIGADEWNSVPAENGKTCDINGDGSYNIIDVVALLLLAHEDLDDPRVDWNGDGAYTVTDAVALLLDIMNGDCPR